LHVALAEAAVAQYKPTFKIHAPGKTEMIKTIRPYRKG